MISLVRQKISIHPNIMDMLNEQIKNEQKASSIYLSMASWCDQNGFINSASFYYSHAREEQDHLLKIFKFVNEQGGAALSPSIGSVQSEFKDLKSIFEQSLELEITVTQQIYSILKKCREVEDFTCENFIQWFITEQMEEERTFRDILAMIELMKDSPLKLIDERIPTK